jgi:hypothetical protein
VLFPHRPFAHSAFHHDAFGMRGIHHKLVISYVLFEGLGGSVDHHRGVETAVDAVVSRSVRRRDQGARRKCLGKTWSAERMRPSIMILSVYERSALLIWMMKGRSCQRYRETDPWSAQGY